MASVLKITTTINVESDILGKEAGIIVKDVITSVMPAITKSVNEFVNPTPKPETEEKK